MLREVFEHKWALLGRGAVPFMPRKIRSTIFRTIFRAFHLARSSAKCLKVSTVGGRETASIEAWDSALANQPEENPQYDFPPESLECTQPAEVVR